MTVPEPVAATLRQPVRTGVPAQAFPFLTADDTGLPHCCLLSATEIAVADDGGELHVALASRRSRAHLAARRRATLLVVEGTTLHSCHLAVAATTHDLDTADAGTATGGARPVVGVALTLVGHEADSLGIELHPLGFVPPPELAALERWDLTAAALAAVRRLRARR